MGLIRQAGRQPFPGSLSFALFCRLAEGHRYFKTEAAPILLSNGSLPAEAGSSAGHNIISLCATSYPSGWLLSKNQKIARVGKM